MEKYHKRCFALKKFLSLALAIVLALVFCVPVSAAAPNIDFIDVSSNNSAHGLPLSFYQTQKAGHVNGAAIKVSEGTSYINPNASVDIANASQAGMVVSAYHFQRFYNNASAIAEANFFDKALKYYGFNKLLDGIVTVDVEVKTADRETLTNAVNAFIDRMHQLGYPTVDLYTGSYFYNNYLDPARLEVKDPWLAAYPYSPVHNQPTAKFVYKRGAWQWASDHRFYGYTGYFDVSEDYAGKYTDSLMAPNATQPGTPKKIQTISLYDYMKTHNTGYGFGWTAQVKAAAAYGITDYMGTAAQNLALLSKFLNGVKPAPKPTVSPQAATTYTVVLGDTLNGIGARYDISYQTIMNLNGLHSTLIYPGEKLKIKGSISQSSASTYAVQSGDSLSAIASRYHTTVSALASLNGIRNVSLIYPGQVLRLPGSMMTGSVYTVHSGDSLWAIAQEKHTTVAHLQSVNHLTSSLIFPGQKIKY